MLIFNRLQSHKKQGQQNTFKSGGTNNLRAKRAEKIFELFCVQQFQIFSAPLLTFASWYF